MGIRFIWSDEYSVGNEVLDNQHKYLLELGNKIQTADVGQARAFVMELYKYIRVHFTREEAHMKAIGFPGLDEHKEQHEHLITDLNALSQDFVPEKLDALIAFLHTWLVNHVLHEDKAYFRFARSH